MQSHSVVPFYFGYKDSRKVNGKVCSTIHLEKMSGEPELSFELQHDPDKNYARGGIAVKVKTGTRLNANKKYAVKQFNTEKNSQEEWLLSAMRAAVFLRALGAEAYPFISEGKIYILSDWYEGRELKDLNHEDKLQHLSISTRLRYALQYTQKLAVLHSIDVIHRDVKPENCIITNDDAHLIDLDGCFLQSEESIPIRSFTPIYLNHDGQLQFVKYYQAIKKLKQGVAVDVPAFDPHKLFKKESDVYALGLTLTCLFPELLQPLIEKNRADGTIVTIPIMTETAKSDHKELAEFILSLLGPNCQHISAGYVLDALYRLSKRVYFIEDETLLETKAALSDSTVASMLNTINNTYKDIPGQYQLYRQTATFLKRNLCQPNRVLDFGTLCEDGVEALLAACHPDDYIHAFNNIRHATSTLNEANTIYALLVKAIQLVADENKFAFMFACMQYMFTLPAFFNAESVDQFYQNATHNLLAEKEPTAEALRKFIHDVPTNMQDILNSLLTKYHSVIRSTVETLEIIFSSIEPKIRSAAYQSFRTKFELTLEEKRVLLLSLKPKHQIVQIINELVELNKDARQVRFKEYISTGLISMSAIIRTYQFKKILSQLADDELIATLNAAWARSPDNYHLRYNGCLEVMKVVTAKISMRIFKEAILPHTNGLLQNIDGSIIGEMADYLQADCIEDVMIILTFFKTFNNLNSAYAKLNANDLSPAEKIRISGVLYPQQCIGFYQRFVTSEDLAEENIVGFIEGLPYEDRLTFMLSHQAKISNIARHLHEESIAGYTQVVLTASPSVDNDTVAQFTALLPPSSRHTYLTQHLNLVDAIDLQSLQPSVSLDDYRFLQARRKIMRSMQAYLAEKGNLHNDLITFTLNHITNAKSMDELAATLSENFLTSTVRHAAVQHQFSSQPPSFKLFSYGLKRLMNDCEQALDGHLEIAIKDNENWMAL